MFAAGIVFGQLLVVTSCSDDVTSSATDPLKFPYDVNKDLTVEPGNSFYDYCNGAWLKQHPIPADPSKNIGGVYEADGVMDAHIAQLKAEQPDIRNFYNLSDKIHANSKESRDFINAKRGVIEKPKTKEEAYRTIGRMFMEGIDVLNINAHMKRDKDIYLGVLEPAVNTLQKTTLRQRMKELEGLQEMSRSVTGNPACSLVAQGMGIDESLLWQDYNTDEKWQRVWNAYSVDDLYKMMQEAWLYYEAFADEEGLKAFNARWPKEEMTVEKLRVNARAELNYTISYYLQQRFVPQSVKEKYTALTKDIQASLRRRIEKVEWMSEPTRQNALEKLSNCGIFVAYPDTWHKDCVAELADCKSMAEVVNRLKTANARLFKEIIGTGDLFASIISSSDKDSNGNTVPMDLTLVNAAYFPIFNSTVIYPAMLMPPVMPEEGLSEACTYAVLTIVGHEFTHGFDSNGSKYDKYGNPLNWWTVSDMMNFEDRGNALVRCYSSQELDPVRAPMEFCNGERTLNENIADLGGFLATLDAYIAHIEKQGFSGEQRTQQIRKFYESYAHAWCIEYGDTKFDILMDSDVHSHARLRINGVVMNTDMWYDLYNVNRNHKLYLEKERRTYIW